MYKILKIEETQGGETVKEYDADHFEDNSEKPSKLNSAITRPRYARRYKP